MKRTLITILAMLPAVLLAIPGLVAAVDAGAWIVLGSPVIGQTWDDTKAIVAVTMGALSIPVGGLALSVLNDWRKA